MANYDFIHYNDYLLDHLTDSHKAYYRFSDPSINNLVIAEEAHFRSDIDQSRIEEQAKYFGSKMASLLGRSNTPLGKQLSDMNLDRVEGKLRDAYIYSLYKVVHYYRIYEEKGVSSLNFLDAGLVFGGHLLLLSLLSKRFIKSEDNVQQATLYKHLSGIGAPALKSITTSKFYKECDKGNQFFNLMHERVLEELSSSFAGDVCIVEACNVYPVNGRNNPLGNICIDMSGDFNFITAYGSYNDTNSLYWNSALGITLTKGCELSNSESIYQKFGKPDTSHVIRWEVQAITGIKEVTWRFPYERDNRPLGSGGDSPSDGNDDDPRPGNPSDRDGKPFNKQDNMRNWNKGKKFGRNSGPPGPEKITSFNDGLDKLEISFGNNGGNVSNPRTIVGKDGHIKFDLDLKRPNAGKRLIKGIVDTVTNPSNIKTVAELLTAYGNLRLNNQQLKLLTNEQERFIAGRDASITSTSLQTPMLRISRDSKNYSTFVSKSGRSKRNNDTKKRNFKK